MRRPKPLSYDKLHSAADRLADRIQRLVKRGWTPQAAIQEALPPLTGPDVTRIENEIKAADGRRLDAPTDFGPIDSIAWRQWQDADSRLRGPDAAPYRSDYGHDNGPDHYRTDHLAPTIGPHGHAVLSLYYTPPQPPRPRPPATATATPATPEVYNPALVPQHPQRYQTDWTRTVKRDDVELTLADYRSLLRRRFPQWQQWTTATSNETPNGYRRWTTYRGLHRFPRRFRHLGKRRTTLINGLSSRYPRGPMRSAAARTIGHEIAHQLIDSSAADARFPAALADMQRYTLSVTRRLLATSQWADYRMTPATRQTITEQITETAIDRMLGRFWQGKHGSLPTNAIRRSLLYGTAQPDESYIQLRQRVKGSGDLTSGRNPEATAPADSKADAQIRRTLSRLADQRKAIDDPATATDFAERLRIAKRIIRQQPRPIRLVFQRKAYRNTLSKSQRRQYDAARMAVLAVVRHSTPVSQGA